MGKESKGNVFWGRICASLGCRGRAWITFHIFWEYQWRISPPRVTHEVVEDIGERKSSARRAETLCERLARLDSELEIERGDVGARGEAGRVPGFYEIDEVRRRYGIELRAEGIR